MHAMMIGYRHNGPAGARVALASAPAPPGTLEQARESIRTSRAATLGIFGIGGDALIDATAGIQIRLGPDGRWFPFTLCQGDWRTGEWRPAPGASDDAAQAYRAARRARAARPARR